MNHHPVIDLASVGVFIATLLGAITPIIALVGSTLGAIYYATLIYDRWKYGRKTNS